MVPVEPNTVDQWKQPPYSGYYDGEYVHTSTLRLLIDVKVAGFGAAARSTTSLTLFRYCLSLSMSPDWLYLIRERRTSIDSMLQEGFKPTRTFVFAFGFDEEASSIEVSVASYVFYLRPITQIELE